MVLLGKGFQRYQTPRTITMDQWLTVLVTTVVQVLAGPVLSVFKVKTLQDAWVAIV